jgi:uncharacterized protein (DUF2062 family)
MLVEFLGVGFKLGTVVNKEVLASGLDSLVVVGLLVLIEVNLIISMESTIIFAGMTLVGVVVTRLTIVYLILEVVADRVSREKRILPRWSPSINLQIGHKLMEGRYIF